MTTATINLQEIIDEQVDPKDEKIAELQAIIEDLAPGPLGIYEWDKTGHRGEPLDLTGYHETFRDDFDVNSITVPTGIGPWYSNVHTYFGSAYFRPIGYTPDPYLVENGECRIRLELPAGQTSWQSGIIQTMKANGEGFSQSMGYFEGRVKFPLYSQRGFWGGLWLLSAADFHPEITDHLIEIDINECYTGDYGIHTTVHVKPRRVPQPGDYPERVGKALYTNPQTCIVSATGAKQYPASNNIFDGQYHTYGIMIDEDFVTAYYDGLSIGRFPFLEYFRTPMYFIINSTLYGPQKANAVSPMDMSIDYVRVMAKTT